MSSKAKILYWVNHNAVELDLKIYWDSTGEVGGWTVRMTEIFSNEERIQSYLLLDRFAGMIRLETVLEFFAQDYLPKSWYQDFSMWEFGFDQVKFATTTIPLNNGEDTVVDYGQRCVYCGEDTSFGSSNFVNRIDADTYDQETKEYRDGYGCPSCMALDCDRCDEKIGIDEDYSPHDVYGDNDLRDFSDGSYRVCEDCLTEEEKQLVKEKNGEYNER